MNIYFRKLKIHSHLSCVRHFNNATILKVTTTEKLRERERDVPAVKTKSKTKHSLKYADKISLTPPPPTKLRQYYMAPMLRSHILTRQAEIVSVHVQY
jgi:hypothetical protein